MTEITFGKLEDLPLRDAWKNEERDFTPWLLDHLDHIGEAVGLPLEPVGRELRVGPYEADILAKDPQDDGFVLIESQLEAADHKHLGQIMTYLAGLDARTVIWIAPSFSDPHLSAVAWLNENTADGFSFFAVRLRVVRIGDSPFAPIFEIAEKPNDWDRQIKQKAAPEGAAYYDIKEEFWTKFLTRHPNLAELGVAASRYPNCYIVLNEEPHIDLSIWIGRSQSGIYLRSGWGEPAEPVAEFLEPHGEALTSALDAPLGPSTRGKHFLWKRFSKGHDERDAWPEIMDWMNDEIARYRAAFTIVDEGNE